MGSYTVASKRRIVVMIFGTAMAGQFKGRYATLFFLLFFVFIAYTPIPPSRYSSVDASSGVLTRIQSYEFHFFASLRWIVGCDVAKSSSFTKSSRKS